MGQSQTQKKHNSIWTISRDSSNYKLLFRGKLSSAFGGKLHLTRNSAKGFSLVELIVVIAIVGILTVGLAYLLNPSDNIKKTNDAVRKTDLKQIQTALELYYGDNGSYPFPNGTEIQDGSWGAEWVGYMKSVPEDPKSPTLDYIYWVDAVRQSYRIYATLESDDHPDFCAGNATTECQSAIDNSVTCLGVCNYAVSSSNVSP